MDKVSLEQMFLRVIRFSKSISFRKCSRLKSDLSIRRYIKFACRSLHKAILTALTITIKPRTILYVCHSLVLVGEHVGKSSVYSNPHFYVQISIWAPPYNDLTSLGQLITANPYSKHINLNYKTDKKNCVMSGSLKRILIILCSSSKWTCMFINHTSEHHLTLLVWPIRNLE